jgi:hypothetical protein
MQLEFSRHNLKKKKKRSIIRFIQNSSNGSPVVARGRKDEHDAANSRFSQFCKRAYKPDSDKWHETITCHVQLYTTTECIQWYYHVSKSAWASVSITYLRTYAHLHVLLQFETMSHAITARQQVLNLHAASQ